MDELLVQLDQITRSVSSSLNQMSSDELVAFVEQRQLIVDQIVVNASRISLNHSQQEKLGSILEFDQMIRQRMEQLKLEASDWLMQRDQAKQQRSAYETSYASDSILMDRRN
ncbi:hypothetical protein RE628_26540 [Paenibacillus sp. D2_2]|uniref:hypothetical protein n=1 Tax=Paenibacillus sp. D2_2 TaxID=3073092 RepID=UPI0028157614|nr:hypothetical protein [Paenibacillus sp. D2_2]WMT40658.1 hypothetical protein RE628_26540 [Paenibacillus sp. D2_2]